MKLVQLSTLVLVLMVFAIACGGSGGGSSDRDRVEDRCEDACSHLEDCNIFVANECDMFCTTAGVGTDDCQDAASEYYECISDGTCVELNAPAFGFGVCIAENTAFTMACNQGG